jgi:S1-C subfamily serine protease
MDYRQVFSDGGLREEFLDRFDEIMTCLAAATGLESLEGGLDIDQAAEVTARMAEGLRPGDDSGLEAIILRFARPVHLVRNGTFHSSPDGFAESDEVTAVLEAGRTPLEGAIPSVGRIELRNHRLDWVGTGWMVGADLVVTNRHVAQEFAAAAGAGFAFRTISGRLTHALLDWRREYLQPEESRFRVTEVAWIEPDASPFDAALLRMAETGEEGQPPPPVIELASEAEPTDVGQWIAVIGYPANDSRANPADRQRIFDGIYDHKRLAAGRLTAVEPNGVVHHDATTLGGNSGSAVIDLATGKAVALHFDGLPGRQNRAVRASVIEALVRDHGAAR